MNVDVEDFIETDSDLAVLIEQTQTTVYLMVFRESGSAPTTGSFLSTGQSRQAARL